MEDAKNEHSSQKYKSLLIENIKYRTLLTTKYEQRKIYEKKNEKILSAFIPGTIINIYVKPNTKVVAGDKLLMLEAMKMNNIINSPIDGIIKSINVKKGDRVKKDDIMIEFK